MLQKQETQALLSKKERVVCQDLAAMEIVLISQRAEALLLLDEGFSHAEAAHESGLSIGQVRYALRTFRSKGLAFFPKAPAPEIDLEVPAQPKAIAEKAERKKAKKAAKKKSPVTKKKKKKKKDKNKAKKAEKKLLKSKKYKKGKKDSKKK
ncbi:MAG: helix-turn-helix domain-containing protein [Deltaproteobacteria bacterium]|nr:helix-turn-helix domain-containing protein [Deltaproteobacteria bacterium]